MRRIRIERKVSRLKEDRFGVLPLDPRDPDVTRVKGLRATGSASRRRRSN